MGSILSRRRSPFSPSVLLEGLEAVEDSVGLVPVVVAVVVVGVVVVLVEGAVVRLAVVRVLLFSVGSVVTLLLQPQAVSIEAISTNAAIKIPAFFMFSLLFLWNSKLLSPEKQELRWKICGILKVS